MEIDEVRALAEQKNKKKTAKTTAKSPSVKKATARSSAGREMFDADHTGNVIAVFYILWNGHIGIERSRVKIILQ